jgi:putative membrane protein
MKFLINILKGSIVGISFILPGISGSMLATSLGIYEKLIEALSNLNKKPIKSILSIFDCLIGITLGILIGVLAIKSVYSLFPIPVTLLFIGFILGAVPNILKSIINNKKIWYNFLIAAITLVVMIAIMFIKPSASQELNLLSYFIIGLLTAIPLIVPGLSSAMFLMIFGVFDTIISDISNLVSALTALKINEAFKYLPSTLFLMLGMLIGVVILSKLINVLIKEHRISFNYSVLVILLISPMNIIYSMYKDSKYHDFFDKIDYLTIIASILLLVLGFSIAFVLDKKSSKENLNAELKEE